jgi:hypothetical protein
MRRFPYKSRRLLAEETDFSKVEPSESSEDDEEEEQEDKTK